jgi:hypothetical protein
VKFGTEWLRSHTSNVEVVDVSISDRCGARAGLVPLIFVGREYERVRWWLSLHTAKTAILSSSCCSCRIQVLLEVFQLLASSVV